MPVGDGTRTSSPAAWATTIRPPTASRGVALVDGVNGKRHYPLRDPDGRCACSSGQLNTPPGESLGLFASFPAPPEDVAVMTFQMPEFGSIEVALQ